MVRLTRSIDFSASLRYRHGDLSDEENQRRFGPAARTHGHNYHLEVTLRGEVDPVTGMVFDLSDLKEILEREIMARFDHRDLNADTPYFEKDPPTPENFAGVIRSLLLEALPSGMLDRVVLHQDADLSVTIREEPA
ncbi:MAG: 6-carboxytetrahydropterin synthase [Myxococcales bacterium]|nr:6-carboxytetrahydropterin synthase [Myxococcales bacterium]